MDEEFSDTLHPSLLEAATAPGAESSKGLLKLGARQGQAISGDNIIVGQAEGQSCRR